ncbi:19853_t:CDS:2, partial [Cetraspora pellucida]
KIVNSRAKCNRKNSCKRSSKLLESDYKISSISNKLVEKRENRLISRKIGSTLQIRNNLSNISSKSMVRVFAK